MKLYHGTSIKHLPTILKEGLKPRGKGKGNWKHTIDSHPNVIYLTNAYAIYFAHNASNPGTDGVVIEIDTERLNIFKLVPDEDFLEQVTRKAGPAPLGKSMRYRTSWYRRRLLDYAKLWIESVENMGNCGYMGEIPVEAITRYATVPDGRRAEWIMAGMDPFITTTNYCIVGNRYRNWVRWLFNDPLQDATDDPHFNPAYMSNIARHGITVETVP